MIPVFEDNRGRKIALLAHCLLNQNSISDGTADFPAQFKEVVDFLMANNIGLIQLPCPELTCLGLDRGDPHGGSRELLEENSRIRRLLEAPELKEKLKSLARPIVYQVEEYRKHGFEIVGLVGINRSPSCGIETTSKGDREVPGKGVFMDVLLRELAATGIDIPAVGAKTGRVAESLTTLKAFLKTRPE